MISTPTDIGTLIVSSPETLGGRPRIVGTRVSVQRIAGYYKLGWSAEDISDRLTTVTLAQVYAALAYYHSNRAEIEAALAAEAAEYEQRAATIGT